MYYIIARYGSGRSNYMSIIGVGMKDYDKALIRRDELTERNGASDRVYDVLYMGLDEMFNLGKVAKNSIYGGQPVML